MAKYKETILNSFMGLFIALIILLFVEIGLRIGGVAQPLDVFVPYKADSSYLVMNPHISERIFFNKDENLIPQLDLFKADKTSDIFRIFVLGASTTYGFPYSHNTSFPRILERSLANHLTQEVEVVNMSLTAINTYTLRDFSQAVVEQEPDLVIIYAGHNEFYGVHGAASSYNRFGGNFKKLYFLLRDIRLFNLMESLISSKNSVPVQVDESLMKKLAQDQLIPINSYLYFDGMEQFESNLSDILDDFEDNNIPVILSTLTSNLSDQAPLDFTSTKNESLESYQIYLQGLDLQDADKLQEAKEIDQLRFRAPEQFNTIIKEMSSYDNVEIIDMNSIFIQQTSKIAQGNDLFLEHVHPTIRGYYLMAWAFDHHISSNQSNFEEYFSLYNYGTSKIDSIYGGMLISQLTTRWPFNYEDQSADPTSVPEQIAFSRLSGKMEWVESNIMYYQYCMEQQQTLEASKVARSLMQELPFASQPEQMYLGALLQGKLYEDILEYSLIYVLKPQPNWDYISYIVNTVFTDCPDIELLENYIDNNSQILGEFGNYLENTLNNRKSVELEN